MSAEAHRRRVADAVQRLAEMIRHNPGLPVPNTVVAQHSVLSGHDMDAQAMVLAVAHRLGVEVDLTAESATARHELLKTYDVHHGVSVVQYVVYSSRDDEPARNDDAEDGRP